MSTTMLIDARHAEETRVAVVTGNRLEEFDYETAARTQIKGNIYLAKVTRVEPSLQAAFLEYGGNRQGFLAFSEIHPDYYQIPLADREALLAEETKAAAEDGNGGKGKDQGESRDFLGDDFDAALAHKRRMRALKRRYKIQEVIKKRQVVLVQVVKEERGSKGAAMTTYLSLPGRYCVLMPNATQGNGISRKIADGKERQRLKQIVESLKVPKGMGAIVRTAGQGRTKAEIKRDLDYLLKTWETIREQTLKSTAPKLIFEEGNLIKKSLRDLYDKHINEILVEGEKGFDVARNFMKQLAPSHARKIKPYQDKTPLFHKFKVEEQIDSLFSPVIHLKSGGYVVINPTEALVAIDVNSGKATKEHNIEETALQTNLEAADEIARQLRLRDIAGLIVIDFIDMEHYSNNKTLEKRFRDALKADRARMYTSRISQLGLLEMSRQRLRASLYEISTQPCSHCEGSGRVPSMETLGLRVLRQAEDLAIPGNIDHTVIQAPQELALYLLNTKRKTLDEMEVRYGVKVTVAPALNLRIPHFTVKGLSDAQMQKALEEGSLFAASPAVGAPQVFGPKPPAPEGFGKPDGGARRGRGRRGRRGGRHHRRDDRRERRTEAPPQPGRPGAGQAEKQPGSPAPAPEAAKPAPRGASEVKPAPAEPAKVKAPAAAKEAPAKAEGAAAKPVDVKPAPAMPAKPEAAPSKPAPEAKKEAKPAPAKKAGPKRKGWWQRAIGK